MQHDYDLLIIGAGLAGNCLAWSLKDSGLKIAVIEANNNQALRQSPAGDRALALAAGTVEQLTLLGVWQGITHRATAIKTIHVSDQGHFGKTRLSAAREGVEALGYVIAARDIENHLADLVASSTVTTHYDTRVIGVASGDDAVHVSLKQADKSLNLSAQLLVGADGGQSTVRKLLEIDQSVTDYGQTALVTTVAADLPHNNTAFERFTRSGPLALLPVQGRELAVVWTRQHEEAQNLMESSEADFLAHLQACFGYKLGALHLSAPRRAFPLSLIRAEHMQHGRVVLIGNAVHQLHPVAGQGFNLGLRDVVQLAALLAEHRDHDLGDSSALTQYVKQRERDHAQTIRFTDNVVKIFSNDWLALAALRNAGLTLLDHLPGAKHLLARHAMGLSQLPTTAPR